MNTPDENKKAQQEKSFPGYPIYPANEDVTNQNEQVDFVNSRKVNPEEELWEEIPEERDPDIPKARNSDDSFDPDSDVSDEELDMLESADQNKDINRPDLEVDTGLDKTDEDGDPLNEYPQGYGATGLDLDVPGSAADDDDEEIGEEDEENNYYSLGGDKEEGPSEDF
jgi:hypothetical protein